MEGNQNENLNPPPRQIMIEAPPIQHQNAEPRFRAKLYQLYIIIGSFGAVGYASFLAESALYAKGGAGGHRTFAVVSSVLFLTAFILALLLHWIYKDAEQDPALTRFWVRMMKIAFIACGVDSPLLLLLTWVFPSKYLFFPVFLTGYCSVCAVFVGIGLGIYY